ncbi:MAG: exodeoxyribonuclease VII small subunit [Succinivibrio sp.]|nr:exodeoxyribonuclease VII small subunit [Succinivibrio sp.]
MAAGKMSSLEERLGQLEALTARLESGQLSLDESIQAYTDGMKLALSCKKTLDDMTQKIETVKLNTQKMLSGELESEDAEDGLAAQESSQEGASASSDFSSDDVPF